mmetsp:Transcript_13969/g.55112  ORF Transcript_13969/g.55112 Transcript_13969/m.55112 type:complete len:744 (+) Transcript_13969:56-2287(+)
MNVRSFLLLVIFVVAVSATRQTLHGAQKVPGSWRAVADAADESVTLYIGLKLQNTAELEAKFWAVSDPRNADYGNYFSRRQVDQLIAPSAETRALVAEWLSILPSEHVAFKSNWAVVKTTAALAGSLLDTKFQVFQDHRGFRVARSVGGYSVPAALAEHVDAIGGVSDFPSSMEVFTSEKEKQILLSERLSRLEMSARADNETAAADPQILYMLPGDTTLSSFFQPFCSNGNYTLDASQPCVDQDGYALTGAKQKIQQLTNKQVHASVDADDIVCKPCNEWTSRQLSNCQTQNSNYGYPDNTVYCNAPVVVNLKNYYAITYSLALTFTDPNNGATYDSQYVTYDARPLYLGTWMTPDVLLARYGVPPGKQLSSNPQNSQAVAEFSAQYYSQEELDYWFSQMNVAPGPVEVQGRNVPAFPGQEATLDIQFMMGVAQNVTTYFWTEGYTFLGWIVDVVNSDNPPLVNSVSYAGAESSYPQGMVDRMNQEFQAAGTIGVSILFASGDWGVSFPGEQTCEDIQHFTPLFPASSPYITSVGGTQFSTATAPICSDTVIGLPMTCDAVGEITCSITTGSRITTGGGFSDLFPMPSYQTAFVNHYLEEYVGDSIPSNYYNSTNRAYPDIAASARNYLVYVSGDWNPVDGTSAATPVFAALLTLGNEMRLNNGLPPLGFVNPLLYQNMIDTNTGRLSDLYWDTYYDITMGDNKCGELGMECCSYGWSAAPGWDAVTGLGTSRNLLPLFMGN